MAGTKHKEPTKIQRKLTAFERGGGARRGLTPGEEGIRAAKADAAKQRASPKPVSRSKLIPSGGTRRGLTPGEEGIQAAKADAAKASTVKTRPR